MTPPLGSLLVVVQKPTLKVSTGILARWMYGYALTVERPALSKHPLPPKGKERQ